MVCAVAARLFSRRRRRHAAKSGSMVKTRCAKQIVPPTEEKQQQHPFRKPDGAWHGQFMSQRRRRRWRSDRGAELGGVLTVQSMVVRGDFVQH